MTPFSPFKGISAASLPLARPRNSRQPTTTWLSTCPLPSEVVAFQGSNHAFYLDFNGNGTWDGCGTDRCIPVGGNGDIPWSATGTAAARLRSVPSGRDGTFYLDYNGSGTWDGCGIDRCLQIGMNGDIPLVGDWNGSGTARSAPSAPPTAPSTSITTGVAPGTAADMIAVSRSA